MKDGVAEGVIHEVNLLLRGFIGFSAPDCAKLLQIFKGLAPIICFPLWDPSMPLHC